MDTAGPQLINLASFISGDELKGKKSLTSTVEKYHNWADNGVCCFAGANDELVVAASRQRDLHVWSVREGRSDSSTISEQIMHFTFDDDHPIRGVFYSKHRSTLISCSLGNHINTWTSVKLPQIPTENHV